MVALTATQERNLRAALAITENADERARLAFAIWTESRALILANDGTNTSKSTGVDDAVRVVLRRSLDIPHDAVGSNGRSTGMLQQISSDVGGGWGDMAGTMNPAESARRFLAALRVTSDAQFAGTLQTPTGSRRVLVQLSDPIAADVLRVQQPLADEAESSNYNASQVAIAHEIVAQLTTPSTATGFGKDWTDMPTKEELTELLEDSFSSLQGTMVVRDNDSGWHYSIAPGHFQAVSDTVLSHGQGTGLMYVSKQALNWVQLTELRNWAFAGQGDSAAASGAAAGVWHDGGFS